MVGLSLGSTTSSIASEAASYHQDSTLSLSGSKQLKTTLLPLWYYYLYTGQSEL